MATESQSVIVQNGTGVNIIKAVVEMSRFSNGGNPNATIKPLYDSGNGEQEVSATNPLPPAGQASIDISGLHRRFRFAIFKYRFQGGTSDFVIGPYITLPAPARDQNEAPTHRFMLQVRFAVQLTENKYVQVQIEDQLPHTVDMKDSTDERDTK
jgi:hypothetical protein